MIDLVWEWAYDLLGKQQGQKHESKTLKEVMHERGE